MRLNKNFLIFISIVYSSEKFGKWPFYHAHYAFPKCSPLVREIRNATLMVRSSVMVQSGLFSDSRISVQLQKGFFTELSGIKKSTVFLVNLIKIPVQGSGQFRFAALLSLCSALLLGLSFFLLDQKEPKNQDKTKLLPANHAHPRRFVKPARFGSFGLNSGPFQQKIRLIFMVYLQPILKFWKELFDFHLIRFSLGETTEEVTKKRKSKSSSAIFLFDAIIWLIFSRILDFSRPENRPIALPGSNFQSYLHSL